MLVGLWRLHKFLYHFSSSLYPFLVGNCVQLCKHLIFLYETKEIKVSDCWQHSGDQKSWVEQSCRTMLKFANVLFMWFRIVEMLYKMNKIREGRTFWKSFRLYILLKHVGKYIYFFIIWYGMTQSSWHGPSMQMTSQIAWISILNVAEPCFRQ